MAIPTTITEAEILAKVVQPDLGNLSPTAAREVLKLRFDSNTTAKIRKLLQKNNRGTITGEERLTLEHFLRVGRFLDLLHAKARLALISNDEKP